MQEHKKKHISERELESQQSQVGYRPGELRVFIADIVPPDLEKREAMEDRMLELENLVTTYGGVVILEHIQKRLLPDYGTYIGGGKLEEIMIEMQTQDANLLILGNILKPLQIHNLNEELKKIGAKAWDRVDLILKIFEKNARTEETKLQIELAAIKHMGPRIFDMGMELGKQAGKGSWESNTEIMKRHLARREMEIRKDLEKYKQVRETHRQGRRKKGFLTVGIVGYTNAGKSSLMNALTGKWVLAEDKLFATLGTSVGKMWMPSKNIQEGAYDSGVEILFSDTIGFIRDLPPKLVDAFASTLEDSIESDILFHVIDASDPKMPEKIQVVEDILERIWAKQERVYIYNKVETLSKKYLIALKKGNKDQKAYYISTYTQEGFEELKELLLSYASYTGK